MKSKNRLYWALFGISVITIVSGLGQLVMPGFVLGLIGGESTNTTDHFFAIVGMFMFLFGGALLHALMSAVNHPVVVFWSGLQKFGAAMAVGLGVLNHVFSPLALLVAGFDLLSGVLIIAYWIKTK